MVQLFGVAAFVALAVLGPRSAHAQDARITGVISAQWGDPVTAGGASSLNWSLVDDGGTEYDVAISPFALSQAGGIRAIDRRRVVVAGQAADGPAALSGDSPSIQARSISIVGMASLSVAPPQLGSKRYALLMCRFSGNPAEPISNAAATTLMSNSYPNLDHYYRELSDDQMNLVGSRVYGWFDLPQPQSFYMSGGSPDLSALANDCTAAADPSVDFSGFDGIITQFNENFGGSAWGGSRYMTLDGVSRSWPFTWMPLWATQSSKFGVYAHEIGHSLGLPHSSGPYGSTYDSEWDVMSDSYLTYYAPASGSVAGHTIIYHKDRLGWIPASRKWLFSGTGVETKTLEQAEFPVGGGNPLMLRVTIPGSSSYYTAESRRLVGYDQPLPGEAVVIHKVTPGSSIPAKVVDADGDGDTNDDGAMWLPGETFSGDQGVEIEINARTTEGWSVTVRVGETLTILGAGTGSGLVAGQAGLSPAISCSISAGGSSGACDGGYDVSQTVTLTATPSPGSDFVGWSGDCSGASGCSFTMNQPRSVTAEFAQTAPQCTATILAGPGGTASLTSGTASGACGRSVTASATPSAGFAFAGWSDGSSSNPYSLTVDTSLTLTASFSAQCAITVAAGAGGQATLSSGVASGPCGHSVTAAATADSGFTFAGWSDGSSNNPYSLTVDSSFSLTASFSSTCSIAVSAGVGGQAALTGGLADGACGRSVTLTATADSGFAFGSWSDGSNANPYVLALGNSQALVASFVAQCSLTVSGGPGGSAALSSGVLDGPCGRSTTVAATPDSGFAFSGWSDGASTNPYTVVIGVSQSLTASFTAQCTIAVSAETGGSATLASGTPAGDCVRDVTISATADSGFAFTEWSDGATSNPYSLTLTESRSITALFTAQCTITLSAGDGGTAALTSGVATGDCGRDIVATAVPATGFAFAGWSDGSNANPYSMSLGIGRELAATFVAVCTISSSANPSSAGIVQLTSGVATGECGRSVTVTALPYDGYLFIRWSESGSTVGTDSTLVVPADRDRHVTAHFASIPVLADRTADALLGAAPMSPEDVAAIDAQGNGNGSLDLGDLIALLDRVPGGGLTGQILGRIAAATRPLVETPVGGRSQ